MTRGLIGKSILARAADAASARMKAERILRRQSSDELSNLAAKVLNGHEPTRTEILSLAASVLSQDETPGPREH